MNFVPERVQKFLRWMEYLRYASYAEIGLARAAATAPLRQIDASRPLTWGFCGLSQNDEDGISEFLLSRLRESNRYFIEIGASDGLHNNTAWLALARRYSGLMIEGNAALADRGRRLLQPMTIGVRVVGKFVDRTSADEILALARFRNPDFLSLDIDGNDYWVAEALFGAGLRPRVAVVEYNSSFGPERTVTIAYKADFDYLRSHPDHLYFGASIMAWRKFFARHGYCFVTVEQNGVNAFFVDPAAFEPAFLEALRGDSFRENSEVFARLGVSWPAQLDRLKGFELVEV